MFHKLKFLTVTRIVRGFMVYQNITLMFWFVFILLGGMMTSMICSRQARSLSGYIETGVIAGVLIYITGYFVYRRHRDESQFAEEIIKALHSHTLHPHD